MCVCVRVVCVSECVCVCVCEPHSVYTVCIINCAVYVHNISFNLLLIVNQLRGKHKPYAKYTWGEHTNTN